MFKGTSVPSALKPNGYTISNDRKATSNSNKDTTSTQKTSDVATNVTGVTTNKKKDRLTEESANITEPPTDSEMSKFIKSLPPKKNVVVRHEDFPENTPMTEKEYDMLKTLY